MRVYVVSCDNKIMAIRSSMEEASKYLHRKINPLRVGGHWVESGGAKHEKVVVVTDPQRMNKNVYTIKKWSVR